MLVKSTNGEGLQCEWEGGLRAEEHLKSSLSIPESHLIGLAVRRGRKNYVGKSDALIMLKEHAWSSFSEE